MGQSQAKDDDSAERVKMFSHAIEIKNLKPGDHIYYYKDFFYRSPHHGIYIGEPRCEVIHFGCGGIIETMKDYIYEGKGTRIRSCTLSDFCNGSRIRLVAYNKGRSKMAPHSCREEKAISASETVQLAKHFFLHPDLWRDYDERTNNSEVFAAYCKTSLHNESVV